MWRKALYLGRRALPYLRSAAPLTLMLVAIAVIAAVWWLGPQWQQAGEYPLATWQARALVTLGVVLLMSLAWGWVLARKLKQMNRAKADEARVVEDPVLVYERRQQRLLDKQLQVLKDNLPGRHAEYRLPWYLVIGLQDAGKTSLIQRAGQNYTLTNVTRNTTLETNPFSFEWWVGDDGVLIDPDGALLRQSEGGTSAEFQQRLWQHFIQWLTRNRPQRPLNGVVLAVDLAEFSRYSVEQRQTAAITLRTRLRELMEQLGSRLPVYISFTKMDLLYGFSAFFRELPKAEREQPFGFTFPVDLLAGQDDWLNQLDTQYDGLVDRLNQRLPDVLANTRDIEERAAAYSFSRQLAGLKTGLQEFLAQMLSADAFSTPALVRGVYFTSVLQEGVPEDAFVTAAAANYQLTEPIQPAQRGGQSLNYFTASLFPSIIYPESGLAGDNIHMAQRRRRRVSATAIVAVFAGLGITAGWQHYFIRNAEAAAAVEERVLNFVSTWRPIGFEPDTAGRNLLEPLDRLREATLAFGDYRKAWPVVADMGLYQGTRVGPKTEASYLDMLAYQFLPALMLGVNEQMSRAPDNSPERLSHLRVLRMLYDGSGRRDDIVVDYMNSYWQRMFPGQRDVQQRLRAHLDYGLAYTDLAAMVHAGDATAAMTLTPFQSSVQWAQNELGRMPTPERVYRDLDSEATSNLRTPLNLAQQAGPGFGVAFTPLDEYGEPLGDSVAEVDDPLLIPGMLTRQGLETYFLNKSGSVTELALIDAWVLGRRDNIDFSKTDEDELRTQLQSLYAEHYANSWRQALSRVDVQSFRDLNHGVRVLESLTSGHQPLTQLLLQVQKNTQLTPEPAVDTAAARKLLQASSHYGMAQEIERQFGELNQLLVKEGDAPSGLDHVTGAVANLHVYLRRIQEAPDRGKVALAAARARMGLQGADPIFTLQRLAISQPAPLDRMLTKLAGESWRVVLDQAVAQLERQWYQDVYQPFQQTLARQYPFNPAAGRDVALHDFERFFGPGGTLNRFYNDQLKLFLEDHPEHVMVSNRASFVRRDVLSVLDRAGKIREAFFTRGGSLDVEFALEPLNLSSNKRRSVVNLDGQLVEFSHGPRQSIPLVWPNTLRDTVESRITLVPVQINRSPRSVSERGPWALFRLLDKADVTGVSSNAVGLVSDTLIVAKFADIFIYVVSANNIDKRHLAAVAKPLYEDDRLPKMNLLLNGTNFDIKGYGYGYGYGNNPENKKKWYQIS